MVGLYDAPLYRDWAFWLTAVVAALTVAGIGTSEPSSGMPVWLDTLLAAVVASVPLGVFPAWCRRRLRRAIWIRKQKQMAKPEMPPGASPTQQVKQEAGAERERSVLPVRAESTEPSSVVTRHSTPPKSEQGASLEREIASPEALGAQPTVASNDMPFSVAYTMRRLKLAQTSAEQYQAILDVAEALTITLGVTAAALLRSMHEGHELRDLQEAYLGKGVSLGTWLDTFVRLRNHALTDARLLPSAAVTHSKKSPGIHADLAALIEERNRAAHGARPRVRHEAAARVAEWQPPLERAIAKAAFLRRMPWVLTQRTSYQQKTRTFVVTARFATGDHPDFETGSFESSEPLEEDTFYLLRESGPVPLGPFVASRFCEVCRDDQVCYADRVQQSKGTSFKEFARGHVIFAQDLSAEFRSLAAS